MNKSYAFKAIEEKWQEKWQKEDTFASKLIDKSLPKYYILEMFPYPSGKMHMGHVRNYTLGDITARYKKSKGFNVLHPMGWDAFGLPAENAAKENNTNPSLWTYSNIAEMKKQFLKLGFSIDWNRELITCSPQYYAIEQEIFIKLFEAGLAYKKEAWVNWDPVEKTVLANEQVVDGKGWRSGALVEQKKLNQWSLKITHFADELLNDLEKLPNWPEKVKNMQHNWIGKSFGANVDFKLDKDLKFNDINCVKVYSTKVETLFGATFVALSVYHNLAIELAKGNVELDEFIKGVHSKGTIEENIAKEEKLGFDTGIFVINPINKEKIPLYVVNYVLDYGCGAIFGCPAHDERDFEFAKNYKLAIKQVIYNDSFKEDINKKPYLEDGILINSDFVNGLSSKDAKDKIIEYLQKNNLGVASSNYRLKDWGVSRQRYWGTPIPMVNCETCGVVPVDIKDLPIALPEDVDFSLDGNPLFNHPTWKHRKCPKCNAPAIAECDTFDTFFESSWYFLRFATIGSNKPFDEHLIKYWLPVDQYIGGIEHAVMHLLYARFFVKALSYVGMLDKLSEPFVSLMTQGMICHKTYKNNTGNWVYPSDVIMQGDKLIDKNTKQEVFAGKTEKMSKSKKNIVDPSYICSVYGADTARLFVLSDSPPQRDLEWSDEGVEGTYKFINRLWNFVVNNYNKDDKTILTYYEDNNPNKYLNIANLDDKALSIYKYLNKTLLEIELNIKDFHFNKAIALCRELFNHLDENKGVLNKYADLNNLAIAILLQNIGFFAPHLAEELWEYMGFNKFLFNCPYINYNEGFVENDSFVVAIQISGKTRASIELKSSQADITSQDLLEKVKQIDNIAKHLQDKEIKKVIYVPKKIINLVC